MLAGKFFRWRAILTRFSWVGCTLSNRLYISLLIKLWQDAIAQEKLLFRPQDMLQCGIFQLAKWQ